MSLWARFKEWLSPPPLAAEPDEAPEEVAKASSSIGTKYQIDDDGVASSLTHRVVLDEDRDLGIWVQPGAFDAVQQLEHEFTRVLVDALDKRASALGKKREELQQDDLRLFEPPLDDEYLAALSAMFDSCLVTWEEGLVAFGDKFVMPKDEVQPGRTAREIWIDYMCRRNAETVLRICRQAAARARRLEGNSQGPSAGTGGTDEAQRAAEAPESTADDAPPAADQAPPERSAGTSEVSASPA